jgi:hypothetical protein
MPDRSTGRCIYEYKDGTIETNNWLPIFPNGTISCPADKTTFIRFASVSPNHDYSIEFDVSSSWGTASIN